MVWFPGTQTLTDTRTLQWQVAKEAKERKTDSDNIKDCGTK